MVPWHHTSVLPLLQLHGQCKAESENVAKHYGPCLYSSLPRKRITVNRSVVILGEGDTALFYLYGMCHWIRYSFQISLNKIYISHVCVFNCVLFPGLSGKSSWVVLHVPMGVRKSFLVDNQTFHHWLLTVKRNRPYFEQGLIFEVQWCGYRQE